MISATGLSVRRQVTADNGQSGEPGTSPYRTAIPTVGAHIFDGPLRPAPLAASSAPAMIIRLCLEQDGVATPRGSAFPLPASGRSSGTNIRPPRCHCQSHKRHRPIRSDQFQHAPPLHPEPPVPRPGWPIAPQVLDGLMRTSRASRYFRPSRKTATGCEFLWRGCRSRHKRAQARIRRGRRLYNVPLTVKSSCKPDRVADDLGTGAW